MARTVEGQGCLDQHLSAPPETGEDQVTDGPARGVVRLPEAA